jgi:hypothetical protein
LLVLKQEQVMSEMTLEKIEKMIYVIRGTKVMLDSDLAELYGVETKNLNKAVKRNISRFPEDFILKLDSSELADLRFQIGTANRLTSWNYKKRMAPILFTENGVAMLSGILNSERAISVNISIMRTFTKIRSMLNSDEVISKRIRELEKGNDQLFKAVFDHLEEIDIEISTLKRETPNLSPKRKRIGLRKTNEI